MTDLIYIIAGSILIFIVVICLLISFVGKKLTYWKDVISKDIREDYGGRLRVFREDKNMTIEKLSNITGFNISEMEQTGNIKKYQAKILSKIFNIDYRIFTQNKKDDK